MKELEAIDKKFDKMKQTEDKIKQFSEILDSLEATADKKKLLWKEIYQNAVEDRDSANKLFSDAYIVFVLFLFSYILHILMSYMIHSKVLNQ